MRQISMLLCVLLLTGCQVHTGAATAPATLYDFTLTDDRGQMLSAATAAERLAGMDVIMVGELHGHPGVHRFQATLLATLLEQPEPLALAMEQFTRNHQAELNAYLSGKLGEDAFIEQAGAWPSYRHDYRPLIELAKSAGIDVIAANAPRHIVRCIGRQGPGYLDKLPATERGWVAGRLTLDEDEYKSRFMNTRFHGHSPDEHQFAAQTAWDDTMAESMAAYLATHPGHRIMLTVGRFHIADGLGTAQRLKARMPALNIALIYPVLSGEATPDAPLWSLKVQALPAPRLDGEPFPAIKMELPECL
ncbi:ChaN family lipoprotein [Oceanimonas baumannii]|uniref:ChaN family lipoprotein n=1 Tax=Oceanimonas baumannii TaxID=129578 RepID=UPI001D18A09B|nr:ChaN family lipoprotein [Oceanimonas baumannii]MCC4263255.1 ChaN family lipoprotein [Oceanimonas baumannii]